MWVKGDDFHESVSPKAIQWAGTAGTKGVDQHGAAPGNCCWAGTGVKRPRAQ